MCCRLRLKDDDNSGNAAKGIATTASSTGLPGRTHRDLLALILLYHHLAHNSDTTVFLAAPLYPTGRLLWK